MTDEEICMLLNTYMYLDYREAVNGQTLQEILADLSVMQDCQEGGLHYGEYVILRQAAAQSDIGKLVIGNQSWQMQCDAGTNACSFTDREQGCSYVVYRGTADGEWPDNGRGLFKKATIQQKRALDYFDTVIEQGGLDEQDRIVITGHSKGGNKAQFVTMATEHSERIERCCNIDGQGVSDKAVSGFLETYGEDEFDRRRSKILGIYGENDYVNVLGRSLIKEENIRFVKTPVKMENFAGYHDIKYMFARQGINEKTGETVMIFGGRKNPYTQERGVLGEYAKSLSDAVMELPGDKRDGCCGVLMQIMELKGSRKLGLNGEMLTVKDVEDFFQVGLPVIAKSLVFSAVGQTMLERILHKETFAEEPKGSCSMEVHYGELKLQAESHYQFYKRLKQTEKDIEEAAEELERRLKGNLLIHFQLKRELQTLETAIGGVRRQSEILRRISHIYKITDEEEV